MCFSSRAADAPRILLNLGGMANLTYVPRRAQEDGVLAFDTGPGVARDRRGGTHGGRLVAFDRDGRLAAQGTADEAVLAELLADPFFAAAPPKSTGRERFGDQFAAALHDRVPGADGVTTAVELTARSVAAAVDRWIPHDADVIASGGGCHHPGLMAALERHLAPRAGAIASAASMTCSFPVTRRRRSPSRCWAISRFTASRATCPRQRAPGGRGFSER